MSSQDHKDIILFDGVCNLCNRAVNFIIKRDRRDRFRFAALQSERGIRLSGELGIKTKELTTVVLVVPGEAYYTRSTAALKIARSFGGLWQLMVIFEWLPPILRDWVYDIIAKYRYRWFGKRDDCMIPTEEVASKFLT